MNTTRIAIGAALVGAVALGAVIASNGVAQDRSAPSGALSERQREEVEAIVEAYIRQNPGKVIEALNAYAEQERVAAAEGAREAARDLVPTISALDGGSFVAGAAPDKAKVVVVEYFDYHCGFCKRANGLVRELTKNDPDVKMVFREYPLLREESDVAAAYALAAKEQGKYLDFHFAMMEAPGVLTKERLRDIAGKAGLDVKRLEADAEKPSVKSALAANHADAREFGVDGTPTFVIATLDGAFIDIVPGFRPNDIVAAIEEAKTGGGKK